MLLNITLTLYGLSMKLNLRNISMGYIILIPYRAVIMSGSVLAPWAHQVNARDNARILAQNLGCYDTYPRSLLQCLQVFITLAFCCSLFDINISLEYMLDSLPYVILTFCHFGSFRTSVCWTLFLRLIG